MHADANRAADSFALYDLVANVLQRSPSNFTLVPSYSVTLPQYVSYAVNYLGSGINRVKAFAIPATFGTSPTGGSEWGIAYAIYSDANLLQEVRRSVLRAEVVLNTMRQVLLARNPAAHVVSYTDCVTLTSPPTHTAIVHQTFQSSIARRETNFPAHGVTWASHWPIKPLSTQSPAH